MVQSRANSSRTILVYAAVIVGLAFAAYLPLLSFPLLEDDYPLIGYSNDAVTPRGPLALLRDPVQRPRAASLWLFHLVYRTSGMNARSYYLASLVLHACSCLLVFALGLWRPIGFRAAFWAAVFFAVYDGHSEGVMWVSANNELLLFLGLVSAFVCWVQFLNTEGQAWIWYVAALACYGGALLAKESAAIGPALLLIPMLFTRPRIRDVILYSGFVLLAAVSALSILGTRGDSGHFRDGSFSLTAPFVWTFLNSYARILWIWGAIAICFLLYADRRLSQTVRVALIWMGLSLIPYVFLTYNTRVPSRHTYLASAGLALLVGAAIARLGDATSRRTLVAAVAVIMVLQNTSAIWTRKAVLMRKRAEPTERLISFARQTAGPIYIRCFPRNPVIAEQAVRLMTLHPVSDVIWDVDEAQRRNAPPFCYKEP